jgi:hypothetical protein
MSTTATTTQIRRLATAVVAGALAFTPLALPAPQAAAQDVVVSPTPDPQAPRVSNGRVYAIDTYGPLVAVGGSFTTIRPGAGGADSERQWLFIYNSETGAVLDSFQPQLTGTGTNAPAPGNGLVKDQPGVEAVQFAPDGQSLYVGGWFTSVNGAPVDRLVRLGLDGQVVPGFSASFNNTVTDLELTGDRLIVSGRFGQANGQPAARLLSVDPQTGATQYDFNLPATESRNQYGGYVNEIDASDDGRWLVVSGSFRKIAGQSRNQLALIDLQGTPSVANWSTDTYAPNCSASSTDSGSYIRGLAFSPDSSFFVVSTTGAYGGVNAMCDTTVRWDVPPTASGDDVRYTWRAHTGGDTLWASEVTDSAVYVGGHQRWMNNPVPTNSSGGISGDNDGPGAVSRPGIAALDPLTGVPLSWNPGRDRGRGAEAILATDSHLFVGHDTDLWGGAIRQRLAQLPVAGGTANPQPTAVDLPVDLWFTDGSTLNRASFDGAQVGTPTRVGGPTVDGISWTGTRGGFVQAGKVHYFGASDAFYSRTFDGSTFGPAVNLSATVGYVDTNRNQTPYDQPVGVAETTAATYSNGRIYYLKSNDTRLFQRGYSLESGIIEGTEQVAAGSELGTARALAYIGDWLYVATADDRLWRYHAPDGALDLATRELVDGGSRVDWGDVRGLWATPTSGTAVPPTAPAPLTCAEPTGWKASYWSNIGLQGAATTTRCEAAIDYDYGSSGPSGAGVGSDNFSASWTRTITLDAPGAIKVDATVDDGVRAYVDGKRVIDSWVDSSAVLRTGTSEALPAGEHTVRVEMYERTGSAVARVRASVVAAPATQPAPDNMPGDTEVTSPTSGQVLVNTPLRASGTATDNVGVTTVRVSVADRNSPDQRWLQPNGTFGSAYATRPATLATPGGQSTTWSLGPITLPPGSYSLEARTSDAAGFVDPTPARTVFTVTNDVPDTTKPVVGVDAPTQNQQVRTSTVPASGTATDDTGVTGVQVGVYNRAGTAETRWLQADGTWGPTARFRAATLAAPGATSTGWTLGVPLPDGQYALDVRAVDARGNTATNVWRPFTVSTVVPDTTKPQMTIGSPAKNATVAARTVSASGTTSDDTAVQDVRVAVYDRAAGAAGPWLQADGTWGTRYAFRLAEVPAAGARSSDWSLALDLPDGLYAFDVRAADRAGNVGDSTWWPFVVNAPSADASAPRATIARPASKALTTRRVSLTGSARDDRGVRRVLVAVRKPGTGSRKWLQRDGRWGERQAFRVARLVRPDQRKTGWTVALRLPRGSFQVVVLATDRSANVQRSAAQRVVQVRR